jgi:hypothetical protein
METIIQSERFSVFSACPNNCSGHGKCVHGVCVCDIGFDVEPNCNIEQGSIGFDIPLVVNLNATVVWFNASFVRPVGKYQLGDWIGIFNSTANPNSDLQDPRLHALSSYGYAPAEAAPTYSLIPITSKRPGLGKFALWYVRSNLIVEAVSKVFQVV